MAEVLDRRTALEEAFDSAEADAKGEEYTPPVRETPAPSKEVSDETDPALVETKATEGEKLKDRPRTRGVPPDERVKSADAPSAQSEEDKASAKTTSNLDKAPLGWGPTRDSLWAKVPTEVRAAISKRETEIQQGMSQAGRIRQIAEEYHQVIMPFENVIRSMGTTPREAITNVMQTATAMIVGTQAQKCAVLTEMIQRYGVDLPELDRALTAALSNGGNKSAQVQPNTHQPVDPRIMQQLQPLFSLQQRLEQAEGQKQQQLQQEAVDAINSVESRPYFADVRMDMADIMEISAKRGHIMTIEQAYDKACQINPEVSKLVGQTARTPNGAVARARRAASTVKGAPGGAVSGGKQDRRAMLEAAWDMSR